MKKVNVIKKLANYGVIVLVGFSLIFSGCQIDPYYSNDECVCYDVTFNIRLPLDMNGYYHLNLDRTTWQTLHRVEGVVNDNDGNMVEAFWVEWESNLYWYLGDTLGYIVTQYLNNNWNSVAKYRVDRSGKKTKTTSNVDEEFSK